MSDGAADRESHERIRREPERFGEVVARFRPRLCRMVDLRMDARLRARLDASDVVQEACREAVERLPEWLADETLPLHVWLRILTAQKLRQLYRFHVATAKRAAGREVPIEADPAVPQPERIVEAIVESGVLTPSGVAMRGETLERLHAALASMKAEDREILALRHFEQLENVDAARLLGITESGASHRYLRAAKRLREIVQEIASQRG